MQGEFAWKGHRVGEPAMEYATGEVAGAKVCAVRTDDLAAYSRAASHLVGGGASFRKRLAFPSDYV